MSTSANEKAGQSGRKSGTERTKKWDRADEKAGVGIFFPTARGHNWYCSTSSRCYTDFARATISRDIFIQALYAAQTKSQLLNKEAKRKTFYNFAERIGFSEHWKLAAESSEFHLTLSRAYRAHFFPI